MADERDLEAAIAHGERLIDEESYEAAIDHFKALADQHPGDQYVLLHLAGAFDSAGQEEAAVAPYRAALAAGLSESEDLRARIQLASTLRNLKEFEESVQILTQVCTEYPENRAARAFLALALASAGKADEAVHQLLDIMLTNPGPFEAYLRSLRWYADDLVS
jgi:thioredoxin-like negative regulator of GroEL